MNALGKELAAMPEVMMWVRLGLGLGLGWITSSLYSGRVNRGLLRMSLACFHVVPIPDLDLG